MSKKITLVKASAGSGKTYDLMNRLSECIKSGIEPENLFATTFTVKAASELQSRIRQRLISDGKPELASRVFDGLIGTVDGICGRILEEYAIDAGLPPSLMVLDDNNADEIFNSSLSDVFKKEEVLLRAVVEAAERLELIKKNRYEDSDWKRDLKKVTETARNNRLGKKELEACAARSISELKSIFHSDTDFSLEYIASALKPMTNFDSDFNNTNNTIKKIREFIKSPTWKGAAAIGKSEVAKKDEDFDIETLGEIKEKLLDSRELFDDISTVINGVFHFAGEALDEYQRYKEKMGLVDFVDQECRTLDLFEKNEEFRALMKERLSIAMVDEFQDTSPIQLALFLKINECTENGSVWVGDPKQAIYGFRGTDSEMMNAVSSTISDEDVTSLRYSWRSSENLVNLANAIFTRAFSNMKKDDIVLSVPDERREIARGGEIEAWYLSGNKETQFDALAIGVYELINSDSIRAEDIAVLLRSNDDCSKLSSSLSKLGLSSSASSGPLLATPEARLVMAAFRYVVDKDDTAALAVLCAYYGECEDVLNTLIKEKGNDYKALRELPFLKNLTMQKDSTPLEILNYVITELSLDRKALSMEHPVKRIQNVEKLRALCIEYMNHAEVTRTSATPSGFVSYVSSSEAGEAEGSGEGTVNVLTYHKAKGLQWPVVILGSLSSTVKGNAFGVHVIPSQNFSVDNPLQGRLINYWPNPFGTRLKVESLEERLSSSSFRESIYIKEQEEQKRLMYVGLTRAEKRLIFAAAEEKNGPRTDWLDSLSDEPFIRFPENEGKGQLVVGDEKFDITSKRFFFFDGARGQTGCFEDDVDETQTEHYPAFKAPSSVEERAEGVELVEDFFSVMKTHGLNGNYDNLGNAVHSYIALNPKNNKEETAEKILSRWQMSGVVSAVDVVSSTDRFYKWIEKNYPDSTVRAEVPMTYTDEHGTLYQGYIDMVLETPEGYVIIDHKTHNNPSDAEDYVSSCAGQLRLYRKALEKATGKPVNEMIINLSTLGRLYRVR